MSRGSIDGRRGLAGRHERDQRVRLGAFRTRALLLVTLLLLISSLTFDPKLYINGDNVDYILLAQKVWREGDLWGSPKYPPLFPLLLAPVQLLFGTGFLAGKILVLLTYGAAGAGLLWLAERAVTAPDRSRGTRAAFFIALAAMLILPVVEFSHYVMSEIPFLLASVIALGLGERAVLRLARPASANGEARAADPGARTGGGPGLAQVRALLPATLAAAAAFYIRTVGIALLAALPLVLLAQRRWRAFAVGAALCIVVLMPWVIHGALTSGEGETYLDQIRYVNPYLPERGTLTPAAALDRLAQNGRQYFGLDIALSLVPYAYSSTYSAEITPPPALPAWGGALVALLLAGGMWRLRRSLPVTVAYTGLFLLVCLAWPPIWASVRFVLPIVPLCFLLVALGVWDGWRTLSARLPAARRPGGVVLAVALAAVLVLSGQRLVVYAGEVRHYPTRWEAYFTALRWAGQNLSPREIVLDRKPNIFHYVTGLEAVSFPREPNDARMLNHLRQHRVTVVHASSIPYEDVLDILLPFLQRQVRYFEPLWYEEVPGGGFSAFLRFHPGGHQEPGPGTGPGSDSGSGTGPGPGSGSGTGAGPGSGIGRSPGP
jgi:hypothetical protein